MKTSTLANRLSRLFPPARTAGASEVALIAAAFVLYSWYWPVSEHIVHLIIFFLVLSLWIERKSTLSRQLSFILPAAFFFLFLAWLFLSVMWSGAFHQSLSYALLVVLTGATAVMLGMIVGLERVLKGIVGGVLFLQFHGIVSPDGDNQREGDYSWGLFSNPSELSVLLGIGLLATVFLFRSKIVANLLTGAIVAYLGWSLWTIQILTGTVSVVVALLVLIPVLHVRRVQHKFRLPLIGGYLFAGIAAIALFWFNRGPLLALVGEDSTMSLRTVIWAYYWEAVMWRPVIGPGWGNSYGWHPIERDRLQQVSEFFPAHNGFIDTALMLGLVGLGLLVATLVALFFAGISRVVAGEFPLRHSFIPVLVVYLSLNDMMATSLPKFIGIFLLGLMSGLLLRDPTGDSAGRNMLLVDLAKVGVEHQQETALTEK